MPTSGNYKITVTLPNGTLLSYTSVGAVTETDTLKTFTGRRTGTTPAETTDAAMTIHKDKIVDQKVDPI